MPRPQLLDRFANTESRRLTLISAPAGYGKTTLVKLWLDDARLPYGWLSLDEYDSDLGTLAGYLVAAVRMAYPGALPTTTSMLTAAFLPEPRRLADVFLRDLEQLAGPIVLVLDDFHLAQSQPVRDFISRVVHHVPEGVHVVLMTRSDPPLSLERLRARGEMNEVRMADLRFSAAESGVLIQQNAGGRVSEDIAALLAERTEGWPAGLQLACLSLRESDDPAAFAQRFAGASDRLVAEYLVNEVLDQLPEDQRRLIVRMSVLDRICGPLCEAISDGQLLSGEGDAFLATTWRSNLFLIALDDEGAWYRYHHLFRDLLRHQLKRNAPAEFVAGLHQRAGAWFEHEGLIEEAIMHAVEGNDSQRAVHLIEANWHLPLKSEDWRRLERWLAKLPEPVSQRPAILIARAFLQHFRHRIAAMLPLLDAAEKGLNDSASPDAPAQTEALLGAINALRSSSFVAEDPAEMVRTSDIALRQLAPDMVFARSLAEFWHIYGLQQAGETHQALEQAHKWLGEQTGQPDVRTLRLLLGLGGVHHNEADLPNVLAVATTYREIAMRMRSGLSTAWANFLLGWAYYYRNQLEAAAQHFGYVAESPYAAHGKAAIDSFVGLALTRTALGQTEAAREAVSRLRAYFLDTGVVDLIPVADSLALRIQDNSGQWEVPSEFTNNLGGQMLADMWEVPGLTAVRAALRSGTPDRLGAARDTLRICRSVAEVRHYTRRRIEIAILEASLHAAQGDDAACLEDLRRAVLLGEPGGGLRFFVDEGPALRPYLRELLEQGVAPEYVQAILAAYPAESAASPPVAIPVSPAGRLTALAPEMDGLLTHREVDVLLLLDQRLTNKEIAARLMISPRTVQKHTINIYEKLHASNRRQVIAQARALGLLPQVS